MVHEKEWMKEWYDRLVNKQQWHVPINAEVHLKTCRQEVNV